MQTNNQQIANNQQTKFWLQLAYAGVSTKSAWKIHENNINSLNGLLSSAPEHLTKIGIKPKHKQALQTIKDGPIEQALAWQKSDINHHILNPSSENFPHILKQINDPPYILYVKGDVNLLAKPQIAIVGARRPTPTGMEDASIFAKRLAELDIVITSGMAQGIDTCAHKGAMSEGKTIAVLGTGIDNVYPKNNKDLAHNIAKQGALVSEYPLGTKPLAYNFPRRNRIISGLSLGVFVVEADLKSGSLITARLAVEQNRDVFALPGSIHNHMARGCHYLIKQGAVLVESIDDILAALPNYHYTQNHQNEYQTNDIDQLTPQQIKVFATLDYTPITVDVLVERVNMPVAELNAILFELQLCDKVLSTGNLYCRKPTTHLK